MANGGPSNERGLTDKQQKFCEEYLIDLNATQAAIRAGYSESTSGEMGYENLNKPQIAEYIASLQAKRSEKVQIDANYVLSRLKTVAERCLQEERVKSPEGGTDETIAEYKFEHAGANKSLELLGKHLGLFTEKMEHSGKIQIQEVQRTIVDPKNTDS